MAVTRRTLVGAAAALPLISGPDAWAAPGRAVLDTGMDRPEELAAMLAGQRVALLTHAAGVDRTGQRSVDVMAARPDINLVAIWSPEHGYASRAAAGEAVGDERDTATGLPILSLYGTRRAPDAAMLAGVDTIVIDLQDVGARPYTYVSTVKAVMQAAARRRIIVIDRPNPLGGAIMEGPVLDPALASFVGASAVPLRHGLTLGELAQFINAAQGAPADLTIVPMHGWQRSTRFTPFMDGTLPFVAPSPNLRSPSALLAYAGTVLIEGTNLSEGRGSDRPFETIGAPYVKGADLAAAMRDTWLTGVECEAITFTPTTSKYAGERCEGVSLWFSDVPGVMPLRTALTLIGAVRARYPDHFSFSTGERPFFDLLIGQSWVREAISARTSVAAIEQRWANDLAEFAERRAAHLLYSDHVGA